MHAYIYIYPTVYIDVCLYGRFYVRENICESICKRARKARDKTVREHKSTYLDSAA